MLISNCEGGGGEVDIRTLDETRIRGILLTLQKLVVQELLETWRRNKSYIWKMFEPLYWLLMVPSYTLAI